MYQKLHNVPLLKGTKQNNKAHQQSRKNKTSFQLLKDYMHCESPDRPKSTPIV